MSSSSTRPDIQIQREHTHKVSALRFDGTWARHHLEWFVLCSIYIYILHITSTWCLYERRPKSNCKPEKRDCPYSTFIIHYLSVLYLRTKAVVDPYDISLTTDQRVIPYLIQAVQYDRRRGSINVWAHVRDAACYTYWAFARAFDPKIMQPFLLDMTRAIILTSWFDHEANCRSPASSAIKEAVGR